MPHAKIMKLKESISRILSQRFVTAKELASIAGQLNSMYMAIGNTSSAARIAYSDASDTGYGGYIVELGPQVAAQGVWSFDE
ncbi:hypothetical protein OS493_032392, partial [Desmophyllum pertusum]